MLSPSEIMAGLTEIANQAIGAAIAWHVALFFALGAVILGWRPSQRTAGALLATPLASVAAFAFAFGNPFNGALFAAAAVALLLLAVPGDPGPVMRGPAWAWWTGVVLIGFGWSYPHFLAAHPATYLYAAPVGLVPCPTLAVVIGLALLAGGLGRRAWTLTLAIIGLFYGLFGALRLGVAIDLVLIGGSSVLAASALVGMGPSRALGKAPS